MEILNTRKFNKKCAVVIGKFDGVHKGHQKLLSLAEEICRREAIASVAYTFCSENDTSRIIPDAKKAEILASSGIDALYIQSLDEAFKNTSPEQFVEILKNDFSASYVIVGFNFRFGKDRCGNADTMKELCRKAGINAIVAEPVLFSGKTISSTRIRAEIKSGNMENVHAMMGRRFSVTAAVIQGKQLGRDMGFPTANIETDGISLLPKSGVYATAVHMGSAVYAGVTNIGTNPTVDNDGKTKCETHIVGFSDDLYGKEITIEFLQFLREEEQFVSIGHLASQLEYDTDNAVKIFKNMLTV